MLQTKIVEKIKMNILCSLLFFIESVAVYEIMKYILEPGRPQMAIRRMRIA
jgi:hypothetical protein